ncbi:hypothetical protein Esti_003264 [Eimeria stiedai]
MEGWEGVGSFLLKVLQPLPAAVPFWLAELQQLAWTAVLCYGDTNIDSGGSHRLNHYLLALFVLDAALGVVLSTSPLFAGRKQLEIRCSSLWLLHCCLLSVKLAFCPFILGDRGPHMGALLPPRLSHLFVFRSAREASSLYFASCCLFLTPVVFLAFAGCTYLQSESPRGTHGLQVGSPPNSLLILADLTLLLTIDLLDLAAAFSTAFSFCGCAAAVLLQGAKASPPLALSLLGNSVLVLLPVALFLLAFAFPTNQQPREPRGSRGLDPTELVSPSSPSSYPWQGQTAPGSDLLLTAKHAFLVGLLLIDIPAFTFRMGLLLQRDACLCPFLLKNVALLFLRPLRLHQCVLAEKEDARCLQREVLTVASESSHFPAASAAAAAAFPSSQKETGSKYCLKGWQETPAAAGMQQPKKAQKAKARDSPETVAAASAEVGAAVAAAVKERQHAFVLHLLDPILAESPASPYDLPLDSRSCAAATAAAAPEYVAAGAAGAEGSTGVAATKEESQPPAAAFEKQQQPTRRPLQLLVSQGAVRLLKKLGRLPEEGTAAATAATAAAAAAAKEASDTAAQEATAASRPFFGRAFTLSRWRRHNKAAPPQNSLRQCKTSVASTSAAVAAPSAPMAAPATAAATEELQAHLPLHLRRRLAGGFSYLRAFAGRRRSTIPTIQVQDEKQQQQQELRVVLPPRSASVRTDPLTVSRGLPGEATEQTISALLSPSLSFMEAMRTLSAAGSWSRSPQPEPPSCLNHRQQAHIHKLVQHRGDEAGSLLASAFAAAARSCSRDAAKSRRPQTPGIHSMVRDGFTEASLVPALCKARSCTNLKHTSFYNASSKTRLCLETPAAATAATPPAAVAGASGIDGTSTGPLSSSCFAGGTEYLRKAAPSANKDSKRFRRCLTTPEQLRGKQRRPQAWELAAQQEQQEQQDFEGLLQELQPGQLERFLAPPPKHLLASLRKRQQQLQKQLELPVRGVRLFSALRRLVCLLLQPRGRGFAAVLDDKVSLSRRQQLVLAAVVAAPHVAKLLLILRPFFGILLLQQQQPQHYQAEAAAFQHQRSGEMLLLGEGSFLLLLLLSLYALLQLSLYLCLAFPLLDILYVVVGGCLRLSSVHALLRTIESPPGGPSRGPPSAFIGASSIGGPTTTEEPVEAVPFLPGALLAPLLLRLLLCIHPTCSLLQLLIPCCHLFCLRDSLSCACSKRGAAVMQQQQQQQEPQQRGLVWGSFLSVKAPTGDDPTIPAGTAGVLVLLLCSNMGAPLSLHPSLVGGPLVRSVRLCDQMLQQHLSIVLLLLLTRGITAGWAPDWLLLVIHLTYLVFCCSYLLLSFSIRLLQLRRLELLQQLQQMLHALQMNIESPAAAAADAAAAATAAAAAVLAGDVESSEAEGSSGLPQKTHLTAAAAAAAAAPQYILIEQVSLQLETEGLFSFQGSLCPPCW